MALIPMFLGYLLFGYGLERDTASTVAIVGERLSTVGWVGLGIIAEALAVLAIAPTNTVSALPNSDPKRASPQMAAR